MWKQVRSAVLRSCCSWRDRLGGASQSSPSGGSYSRLSDSDSSIGSDGQGVAVQDSCTRPIGLAIGPTMRRMVLYIRDPELSLRFYVDLIGLRLVTAPRNDGLVTMYQLGCLRDASRSAGADPVTRGNEMDLTDLTDLTDLSDLSNLPDLPDSATTAATLRLCHSHGWNRQLLCHGTVGDHFPGRGAHRLELVVRDVQAAVERLQHGGVEIVKETNGDAEAGARWQIEREAADLSIDGAGIDNGDEQERGARGIAYVLDPDGHLIKLVSPRDPGPDRIVGHLSARI